MRGQLHFVWRRVSTFHLFPSLWTSLSYFPIIFCFSFCCFCLPFRYFRRSYICCRDGHYGLYFDDTLFDGPSARCPTFKNTPLCSGAEVKGGNSSIMPMRAWSSVSPHRCSRVSSATSVACELRTTPTCSRARTAPVHHRAALLFDERCDSAWLPDLFGLTGALPQLIRGVGKSSSRFSLQRA